MTHTSTRLKQCSGTLFSTFAKSPKPIALALKSAKIAGSIFLFMLFSFTGAFALDGTGVVTVTANNGSCLGFTASVSSGPDNWEVVQGGSYTMTISGVTECTGSAITVFIQSTSTGNFCFNANKLSTGVYRGTFSIPNPACKTMPVSYKCGASAPCNNNNTYNANGQSNTHAVHLRASTFNGSCQKTGNDLNCSNACTLSLSATTINVSCNGGNNGSIDVSVSGAQGSVTYLWNNGATTQDRTGLAAGTYTVTATDGANCTATLTRTITQPSCTIGLSATSVNVSCYGGSNGSIDVSVSGAQGNVTYLWNDGATTQDRSGLAAGTYTITATDGACCSTSLSRTITQSCTIGLSATTGNVSCHAGNDGSIDVSVSGAQNAVTYLWNDGTTTQDRTGLTAGTYTVTATDGSCTNCTATLTKTITEPDEIVVGETHLDVSANGGSDGSIDLTVSGGSGGYTYLWNDGATTEDRSGLVAGTYTVTVTDAHSCTASGTIVINEPDCPPCVAPDASTFTVDSLSAAEAYLCWEPIACAQGYRIAWRTQPSQVWKYRDIAAPTTCDTFTNQYPQVYDIEIATICADGSLSAYSDLFVFHTFQSCSPSGDLYTDAITNTTATAHWNVGTDADQYKIAYRVVGAGNFNTHIISGLSYDFTNLLPSTGYEWKVASICSSGTRQVIGLYSALTQFTTTGNRLSLNEESYSDGALAVYPNPATVNFHIDFNLGFESSDEYTLFITNALGQVVYSEKSKLDNGHLSETILTPNDVASGVYSVSILVNGFQYKQMLMITKQ